MAKRWPPSDNVSMGPEMSVCTSEPGPSASRSAMRGVGWRSLLLVTQGSQNGRCSAGVSLPIARKAVSLAWPKRRWRAIRSLSAAAMADAAWLGWKGSQYSPSEAARSMVVPSARRMCGSLVSRTTVWPAAARQATN